MGVIPVLLYRNELRYSTVPGGSVSVAAEPNDFLPFFSASCTYFLGLFWESLPCSRWLCLFRASKRKVLRLHLLFPQASFSRMPCLPTSQHCWIAAVTNGSHVWIAGSHSDRCALRLFAIGEFPRTIKTPTICGLRNSPYQ